MSYDLDNAEEDREDLIDFLDSILEREERAPWERQQEKALVKLNRVPWDTEDIEEQVMSIEEGNTKELRELMDETYDSVERSLKWNWKHGRYTRRGFVALGAALLLGAGAHYVDRRIGSLQQQQTEQIGNMLEGQREEAEHDRQYEESQEDRYHEETAQEEQERQEQDREHTVERDQTEEKFPLQVFPEDAESVVLEMARDKYGQRDNQLENYINAIFDDKRREIENLEDNLLDRYGSDFLTFVNYLDDLQGDGNRYLEVNERSSGYVLTPVRKEGPNVKAIEPDQYVTEEFVRDLDEAYQNVKN